MINEFDELEGMAQLLEASDRFRVLRRLKLLERLEQSDGTTTKKGMFLDVETTGLDKESELLELAIVPFDYTSDGRIVGLGEPFHQLNEPTDPIPSEITAITGLTDGMVSGQRIDPDAVAHFVSDASIIIAHNAAFDRPFVERLSPVFVTKPWACTMSDVPWREQGFEGRRLSDLLARFGFFFDAHRALDDCEAGIALLTMTLPRNGERVLEALLRTARQPTWRLFAVDAPYDLRNLLKRRSYRWNTDREFGPRAWWIEIQDERVEEELSFLRETVFHREVQIPLSEITAFQRHAGRSR